MEAARRRQEAEEAAEAEIEAAKAQGRAMVAEARDMRERIFADLARRRDLARKGIYLYYLPSYRPEFDRIEGVFRQVKYQGLPRRSYTRRLELREAVERSFWEYGRGLRPKTRKQLCPAA